MSVMNVNHQEFPHQLALAQLINLKTPKENVKTVLTNVKNAKVLPTIVPFVPMEELDLQVVTVQKEHSMTEFPLNVNNVTANATLVTQTDAYNAQVLE